MLFSVGEQTVAMVQATTLGEISKNLTEYVIKRAFHRKTNNNDSVRSLHVTRAAPAGEGLLSAVYRIKVTGDLHTASFVVKGLVKDSLLRKSLDCWKYYKREVLFFSTVLPALIEAQSLTGAKEKIQENIPICYEYHCDGDNDYILLEDMAESNCSSVSEVPTLYERDVTLKALAHFHAVSFALRIKNPDLFLKLSNAVPEVYYTENSRSWYSPYLQSALDLNRAVLTEFESPSSIYLKKFDLLVANDPYGQFIDSVTSLGDYPVLGHGDAWCPNFLTSKDRGVIIDFQLLRCTSIVTDMSYFIFMFSNLCRDKHEFLKAMKIYYDSLVYYLKDMGIDNDTILTWDDLKVELKKYGKYGVLAAFTSILLLNSERCDAMESFEEKYSGVEKIPLEVLWKLTPLKTFEQKMKIVNLVRTAVNLGII